MLSRQEEPADSSERLQSGGEEIKVYHLDETQAVANEMNSMVASDGTVVMETDHFSHIHCGQCAGGKRSACDSGALGSAG
ncbi:MAG: hypothetical protein ACLR0U_21175 [Enterocloster clostridioformis]